MAHVCNVVEPNIIERNVLRKVGRYHCRIYVNHGDLCNSLFHESQ